MFKMKTRKNRMQFIGSSLKEGRHILTNRIVDGMKYTARWTHEVGKSPAFTIMRHRITRKPVDSIMMFAGLGLVVYGISKLLRK
jgi:hypothetical protein